MIRLFWAPTTGARLVIARHDGHKVSSYLADLIARWNVTVSCFVPSALFALSDYILAEEEASSFDGVRLVVACGEALKHDVVDACFRALPATNLVNVYGPTEV